MGAESSAPVDESAVEEAVEQANRTLAEYSQRHLLSAFTVFVEDANSYLNAHPETGGDVDLFRDIYSEARDEEFWSEWGTSISYEDWNTLVWDDVDEVLGLAPGELTEGTLEGRIQILPLAESDIEHEWLIGPGIALFKEFAERCHDPICRPGGVYDELMKPGGLYEKVEEGLLDRKVIGAAIATAITGNVLTAPFLVPIAGSLSLILVKVGLDNYCGGSPEEAAELIRDELY